MTPAGNRIVRLIQRVFAALLAAALLVAGLIFATAFFAVAAVFALGFWLWIQWRLRAARRAAGRESGPPGGGTIIEGEYRVEKDTTRIDRTPD